MTPAKRSWVMIVVCAGLAPAVSRASAGDPGQCGRDADVVVQVLGSGGPELADGRASSAYLLWHRGQARVLVDLGPGAMLRFGQAGARLEDLRLVALSHLHVDHAGDLPALVKSGYFGSRTSPLPLVGPAGDSVFPSPGPWLRTLLAPDAGAFRYLSGALDGTGGPFELTPSEVALQPKRAHRVLESDDLRVDALPVPHGSVPSLAFRIIVAGRTIVFGGDQNGTAPEFWQFARDADLLVAHLAVPEDVGGPARELHATPSIVGDGAARAGVRRLVLSHLMTRSEARLDENLRSIRARYKGAVDVAFDLRCVAVEAVP